MHPVRDHCGPEQSRPPRLCLGTRPETQLPQGHRSSPRGAGWGSGQAGAGSAGLFSAAAFSRVGHFPTGFLAEGRASFPRQLLKPAPLFC